MPVQTDHDPALDALPQAYFGWRQSTLGRITDELEERLLLDRIGPAHGTHVLDVGCGDAALATRLALEGAKVTGLDTSTRMISLARRRADLAGIELDLVKGRAEDLPFPDSRFDLVFSVATLCFSKDAGQSIREMTRVLRPDGRLIVGELGRWNLWATERWIKGRLGSSVWRAAHFRSRGELLALSAVTGLKNAKVTGSIFYPPFSLAARTIAPIDHMIGTVTTIGAAFLVLEATKPDPAAKEARRIRC